MINKKKPEEYIRKILKDEYHDEWKKYLMILLYYSI